MSTTDNKENNKEIKTEALPAKKVSASETHQLHVSSIRISTDLVGCSVEGFWNGSTK